MNVTALDAHVERERMHAALSFELDEALGTHHGISWPDFVLLHSLDEASTTMTYPQMAKRMCILQSQLLRRMLPLKKTGLVAHMASDAGGRAVLLTDAGRRVLREARETAAWVCARAQAASSA
jgi:MarR family transcriptional regulator, organic hydroperoxide resistance regulator